MKINKNIEIVNADWYDKYTDIKKNSIDLILTDLPWGILEKYNWDKSQDLIELEKTFDYVLKDNGLLILFCNLRLLVRLITNFSKFKYRIHHIWKKPSAMPINQIMPLPDAEFIIAFQRINTKSVFTTFNPFESGIEGNPYIKKSNISTSPTRRHVKSPTSENLHGKRWIRTIIEANNKPNMKKKERSSHPTQKPEKLLKILIRIYSNKGDTVLDPFGGSGSTLISAYMEERKSIGFEIKYEYYKEAVLRINNISDQVELFKEEL